MKKIYVKPEVQVKTIEICNMIAASIRNTNVDLSNGGNTSDAGIITGNAKERGNSDDEWLDGLW